MTLKASIEWTLSMCQGWFQASGTHCLIIRLMLAGAWRHRTIIIPHSTLKEAFRNSFRFTVKLRCGAGFKSRLVWLWRWLRAYCKIVTPSLKGQAVCSVIKSDARSAAALIPQRNKNKWEEVKLDTTFLRNSAWFLPSSQPQTAGTQTSTSEVWSAAYLNSIVFGSRLLC